VKRRLVGLWRTLWLSFAAACCALILVLFFYDGPVHIPHLEATAQATEEAENLTTHPTPSPAVTLNLPSGYRPSWRFAQFDGLNPIRILQHPFSLNQSYHRLGSEYYDYAAFLFEQLAGTVPEKELASYLEDLSVRAQTLGQAVRQAGAYRYAGPPTEDMQHLKVRQEMSAALSLLITDPVVDTRYDQRGKLLGLPQKAGVMPGAGLNSFLKAQETFLQRPTLKKYPAVAALVRQQCDLLRELSMHLALRWDGTYYGGSSQVKTLAYIRVYALQTMPDTMVTAHWVTP
jgi:hypothetical protein